MEISEPLDTDRSINPVEILLFWSSVFVSHPSHKVHGTWRYNTTVIRGRKYGRNERVMVKLSDGSTEFMKYKKAETLLSAGAEIL